MKDESDGACEHFWNYEHTVYSGSRGSIVVRRWCKLCETEHVGQVTKWREPRPDEVVVTRSPYRHKLKRMHEAAATKRAHIRAKLPDFEELATEIERLRAIVGQVVAVAETEILPDGDHVNLSTGAWLEELAAEAGGER